MGFVPNFVKFRGTRGRGHFKRNYLALSRNCLRTKPAGEILSLSHFCFHLGKKYGRHPECNSSYLKVRLKISLKAALDLITDIYWNYVL